MGQGNGQRNRASLAKLELDAERAQLERELGVLDEHTARVESQLTIAEKRKTAASGKRKISRRAALAEEDQAAAEALAAARRETVEAATHIEDLQAVLTDLAERRQEIVAGLRRNSFDCDVLARRAERIAVHESAGRVDAATQALKTALREHLERTATLQTAGEQLGFRGWSRFGEHLRLRLYLNMQLTGVIPTFCDEPTFLTEWRGKSLTELEVGFTVPENPQMPENYPPSTLPSPKPKKEAA
jgi:hypothetical protein